MQFITYTSQNQAVHVDGSAKDAPKTVVGGESGVQFKYAEQIVWEGKNIQLVTGNELTIYDGKDIDALDNLIRQKVQLIFFSVHIAFNAVGFTFSLISTLQEEGVKVGSGSKINAPVIDSQVDYMKFVEVLKAIGFEIT